MSFGITIVQLQLALRQPGCPICYIRGQAGARYISNLLWENVNDVETRERIIASLGYCPEHTLLLASMEVKRHGSAMGTSIIYEHLAQVVVHRLRGLAPRRKSASMAYISSAHSRLVGRPGCGYCFGGFSA